MNRARFGWYKDIALTVCVLVLVVVALGAFLEPNTPTGAHHQTVLGIVVLLAAVSCVLFGTSKTAVLTAGLGILVFRSLIAVAFQATGRLIFVGIAAAGALILYALLRSHRQSKLPYDPDKASRVLGVLAAAIGFGLAGLVLVVIGIVLRWRA